MLEQRLGERIIGLDDDTIKVLATCVRAGRSVLIRGNHGTGKTTFCSIVAEYLRLEPDEFVYYDASKDDLVSVAGIPDAASFQRSDGSDEPSRSGLRFLCHERTIWNKKVVLIDEITRAPQESQNLWLEIVGNRSLFGRQLPCQFLVATCNPATYTAAFGLDEALLDRFTIVCDFPDLRSADEWTLAQVALANAPGAGSETTDPLPDGRDECREYAARFRQIITSEKRRKVIATWAGRLVHMIHKITPPPIRVSNRTLGEHLVGFAFDLLARDVGNIQESLRLAATYVVANRLSLDKDVLERAILAAWEGVLAEGGLEETVEDLVQYITSFGQWKTRPILRLFQKLRSAELDANQQMRIEMALRRWATPDNSARDLSHIRRICRRFAPDVLPEVEIAAIHHEVEERLA